MVVQCIMDKYYKYKHIFSGASTIDDIKFIKDKCPPEDYPLIDAIIRSIYIQHHFGFSKMNEIIKVLGTHKYREESEKYIDGLKQTPSNNTIVLLNNYSNICELQHIQDEIFAKIINTKPVNETYIDLPKIDNKCPHCGRLNSAPLGTTYIVCGVDVSGVLPIDNYDESCLNDWCFSCGKRLCKNWYTDELYNKTNRIHDNLCCKIHARKNNLQYPEDYCQCSRRNILSLL